VASVLPALDAAAPLIALPGSGDAVQAPLPAWSSAEVIPRTGAGRIPGSVDVEAILAAEEQRRAQQAAAGPIVELQLFGSAPAAGRSFVFVIDRSKSMGGPGLRALAQAESELIRVLRALQPMHRFQVIAYHDECTYLLERRLLKATPENISTISGHLSGLTPVGPTHHERAILSALNLQPDVIFLLSDGGDPPLSAGQRRRIRNIAAARTSIHCIQIGAQAQAEPQGFLKLLAEENGGSYRYVNMSSGANRAALQE
jgi:hypothetical protein